MNTEDRAKLERLAEEQVKAQERVAASEEMLKTNKRELAKIAEGDIPELMAELGLEKFETTGGLKISCKESTHAGISEANWPKALQWLRDNGHEKLVRHVFTVVPADDEQAQRLTETLAGFDSKDKPSIPNPTLRKWVREMMEEGALPEEAQTLFGHHLRRVAKVEVPK